MKQRYLMQSWKGQSNCSIKRGFLRNLVEKLNNKVDREEVLRTQTCWVLLFLSTWHIWGIILEEGTILRKLIYQNCLSASFWAFLKKWFIWEGPAYYRWSKPWSISSGLYYKVGWESHEKPANKKCIFKVSASATGPSSLPSLSFCHGLPQWRVVSD